MFVAAKRVANFGIPRPKFGVPNAERQFCGTLTCQLICSGACMRLRLPRNKHVCTAPSWNISYRERRYLLCQPQVSNAVQISPNRVRHRKSLALGTVPNQQTQTHAHPDLFPCASRYALAISQLKRSVEHRRVHPGPCVRGCRGACVCFCFSVSVMSACAG